MAVIWPVLSERGIRGALFARYPTCPEGTRYCSKEVPKAAETVLAGAETLTANPEVFVWVSPTPCNQESTLEI
jgi:hypothetical protein